MAHGILTCGHKLIRSQVNLPQEATAEKSNDDKKTKTETAETSKTRCLTEKR